MIDLIKVTNKKTYALVGIHRVSTPLTKCYDYSDLQAVVPNHGQKLLVCSPTIDPRLLPSTRPHLNSTTIPSTLVKANNYKDILIDLRLGSSPSGHKVPPGIFTNTGDPSIVQVTI